MTDKQFLTVAEVARLYSKSVQTIYRHIKGGKLSKDADGMISLSECLRVYGAIPTSESNSVKHDFSHNVKQQGDNTVEVLNALITQLKTDLAQSLEREQQAIEREKRLMALLEHQAGIKQNSGGGFFSGLFKK